MTGQVAEEAAAALLGAHGIIRDVGVLKQHDFQSHLQPGGLRSQEEDKVSGSSQTRILDSNRAAILAVATDES